MLVGGERQSKREEMAERLEAAKRYLRGRWKSQIKEFYKGGGKWWRYVELVEGLEAVDREGVPVRTKPFRTEEKWVCLLVPRKVDV